jgi:hypothetical protein
VAPQVASLDQLGDDSLYGALGDAHLVGDGAHGRCRIACDAHQDVCVVGKESPSVR